MDGPLAHEDHKSILVVDDLELNRTLIEAPGNAVARRVEAQTASVSQIFRSDVQDEILTRLGPARTRMFLEVLLDQCRAADALIGDASDLATIDRKAHDLASTAGMLGYEELWHRCRDLLVATDADARERAVRPIQDALARAITKIEQQVSTCKAVAA